MKCRINSQPVLIKQTPVWTPPYNGFSKNYFVIYTIDHTDPEQKISVEIDFETEIENAVIRPLSAGISFKIQGSKIVFSLKTPCNLSVEINETLCDQNVLQLFINEKKEQNCDGYENVILLDEPVIDLDELEITEDNTLIYLAEGTRVNGKITARNVTNLKIYGSGILSMENYIRRGSFTTIMHIDHCRNVLIEDICLLDSCGWSLHLNNCDEVKIHNVKIIGSRGNADGIDVCGCRNVHVEQCFIRTYDDCLVVKAFDTGNSENLLFEQCTLWNDMARPMEVGVEIRCEELKNVTFRDIDVIHNLTCYPVFGIHHGDRALVSDIHFENIRIEHCPGTQLFDFRITDSVWNKDRFKGSLKNIFVNDIFLVGKEGTDFRKLYARIETEESDISGVYIRNINAYGKKIKNSGQLGLELNGQVKEAYLDGIPCSPDTITDSKTVECRRDCINSHLSLLKEFAMQEDGQYYGTIMLQVTNNTDKQFSGHCGVRIYPKNKASINETCSDFLLSAGESIQKTYEITIQPGKIAVESFGDTIFFRPDILYQQLPYLLKKELSSAPLVKFDNYYSDFYGEAKFALRNGFLEIQSDLLKDYSMTLFAALPTEERENEVLFAVEENFFGEGTALKRKKGRLVPAPEIGNHFEITYVFQNYPDVKIQKVPLERRFNGKIKVSLASFGFDARIRDLLLEIQVHKQTPYDKPLTLFRSTLPEGTAHMYGRFLMMEEETDE